ncbi:MAG: hypothetical protein QOG43_1780 [Actinomycetota bacterium]|nr:hypothetical protein [Actinomycetota bacterium]
MRLLVVEDDERRAPDGDAGLEAGIGRRRRPLHHPPAGAPACGPRRRPEPVRKPR